jgi:hypothetical protein
MGTTTRMHHVASIAVVAGAFALGGCSSTEIVLAHAISLQPVVEEIPESQLLDVSIEVFDPGVPDGEIDRELLEELIAEGTFVQIRRTEALYMAVALRETLQESGYWGAVWVTPTDNRVADINVNAEILHSDGDEVSLQVSVHDATGATWIDDEYDAQIAAGAYNRERHGGLDPYQDLFNSIANDMAAIRAELAAEEVDDIRMIASLRYAAELSPEAFDGYVESDRSGMYELNRLPAVGDPQFNRTQNARQRERLFFETLNLHYGKFSNEASSSYDSWREFSREEAIQIKEIQRSSRFRTGLGIASILASLVYGNNSDNSFSDRVIRDAIMYVGMDMLRTSARRRQEKQLHVESLEELSSSFDDEVEPLVVEVQGTEHRLTGTAELQYEEWKDLLREMYRDETGFEVDDVEMHIEPAPEPDADAVLDEPVESETEARKSDSDAAGSESTGA